MEPRIGAHIRVDKGLHVAFATAAEYGADILQIFTASPRQYRAKPLEADRIDPYMEAWKAAGEPLVMSHASYLINLASPKDGVRERAREALKLELLRCAALRIPFLVLHMGSALNDARDRSMARLVTELNRLIPDVESDTRVLLETSAGQGSSIGCTFEEVGWVLKRLEPGDRFGTCLDTCHAFAAGYGFEGDAFDETWASYDEHVGLDRLDALHLNDSKGELDSRVDRHDHIGNGHIGEEAFRRIFAHERLRAVPCFIETPDDIEWHPKNLALLKSMARDTG
jgi:deoxyribonuclease IV